MTTDEKWSASLFKNRRVLWRALICFAILALGYLDVVVREESPSASVGAGSNLAPRRNTDVGDAFQTFTVSPDNCDSPLRGHFDALYQSGDWGIAPRKVSDFYSDAEWPTREIRSQSSYGKGSNLGAATVNSLRVVKDTIRKYNVTSMVDIPCGDANWIFDSFETDAIPIYIGLDITFAVIELNKNRFAHHKNKQFYFWDASACPIPKFQDGRAIEAQPVDLVHVRDVIQHIPLEQGVSFFCNVFVSRPKVMITTTYPEGENRNVGEGEWYDNNLSKEPFSFPQGECTVTHAHIERDSTCVYDLGGDWVQEYISKKCGR